MEKHGVVVQLKAWRQALEAARMCGANLRTVSKPGLAVSPDATLRRVWKESSDSAARRCSCEVDKGARTARTSAELGTVSFMAEKPTAAGSSCLPLSVALQSYPRGMPGVDAKAIVIANVLLLMQKQYGGRNVTAFGRDTGINTGGAQRVLDPDTNIGVDLLSKIAEHFDLEVWQLLAPNLGQAYVLTPAEQEAVRNVRNPKPVKTDHIGTRKIDNPGVTKRASKQHGAA